MKCEKNKNNKITITQNHNCAKSHNIKGKERLRNIKIEKRVKWNKIEKRVKWNNIEKRVK